jgi:wobble nucleotide-excising tRNase
LLGENKIVHLVTENGSTRDVGINNEFFIFPDFFRHRVPTSIPFLSDFDFGWKVQNQTAKIASDITELSTVFHFHYFQVWIALRKSAEALNGDVIAINKCIHDSLNSLVEAITPAIRAATPISNIRISDGRITAGTIAGSLEAKGYFFEFETNNGFHSFDNLSDGIKRVLLLVANISGLGSYPKTAGSISFSLIEEPELGIHPHQLHLLMNFLKEQSKEKQIIITTHSPQVMDILEKDELDRIIIADFDPEKGSTFRHLTEKEVEKAQFIMEDEPLSNYWKYSDLERTPMF